MQQQTGLSLVEPMIAVAVAAVLLATGAQALQMVADANTESNLASDLTTVYNAAGAYVTTNYAALQSGQPIAGYANAMSPAIGELAAGQFLPAGFSATSWTGGTWRVAVQQVGACPGVGCNLQWLAYLDRAPMRGGKISIDLAAGAAARTQAPAGFSSTVNPANLVGLHASWVDANPMGSSPGILAAMGTYNSSQFSQYLPRSGAVAMTGDLQMNSTANLANAHSIKGVKYLDAQDLFVSGNPGDGNVSASGNITGQNVSASQSLSGDTLTVAGGAAAVDQNGNLVAHNVSTAGSASAAQVDLGTAQGHATVGAGCSPAGALAAASSGSGQILSCQGGTWQAVGGSGTASLVVSQFDIPPNRTWNLGWHQACFQAGASGRPEGGAQQVYAAATSGTRALWLASSWSTWGAADTNFYVSCLN